MTKIADIEGIGEKHQETLGSAGIDSVEDLLENAGVDTVKELATRNAGNLHEAMTTANETKKVAGQVPALKIVESWVTEAKSLPPKVSH